MTAEYLALHLPALLIGVPLFFAFTLPVVARFGEATREWWVLFGTTLTSIVGLALAYQVLADGAVTYTFGAAEVGSVVPPAGKVPVRIVFSIDGMGAMMVGIDIELES